MSDVTIAWNEEFGLWWPSNENESVFKYMLARVTDVDVAAKLCRTTGVAVQAGGFVGMWPMRLAKWFERVYTFEPIPHLYECVKKNCNYLPTVRVHNCVLGPTMGEVYISPKRGGCTTVVAGGMEKVKQITIDSLGLPRCDAIFLDVERYELEALQGAVHTIDRFRPIITLEMKEDTREHYDAFMDKLGYDSSTKVHGDKVYIPR